MNPDFKFAVLGDSRGPKELSIQINKPVLGKLLYNIKKYHEPDFILFGGDMILGRSTHKVDANTEFIFSHLLEWEMFVKKSLGVDSLRGYVFPAIGNHDYSNSEKFEESIKAFNKAFNYLPSGPCNQDMLEGYGKTVYYFDYDNSRFIVLNTVFTAPAGDDTDNRQHLVGVTPEQLMWLEKMLSTSRKANNFVMFHCPIIGTIDEGDAKDYYSLPHAQQEALFRIFNEYKVKGVYCGHEHNYNRRFITNVFFDDEFDLNKSVMQITSGGGGASFEKPGKNTLNIANGPVCVYEYGIVEVYGEVVESAFYDINGTCIDRFIAC